MSYHATDAALKPITQEIEKLNNRIDTTNRDLANFKSRFDASENKRCEEDCIIKIADFVKAFNKKILLDVFSKELEDEKKAALGTIEKNRSKKNFY
jgi:hypothetical protein